MDPRASGRGYRSRHAPERRDDVNLPASRSWRGRAA
jgi:hypothetical protein